MDRRRILFLVIGDLLTLALVTVFGFATHRELSTAGMRMLTTFVPLVAAWIFVSPHIGAYHSTKIDDPRNLWRPVWAMFLAGPIAGWLRGIWLGRSIQPVFVAVLAGVSAAAIFVWRGIYWLISSRSS